jgi:Raf kinase inhibitor-like YbhB/YbcL family protein
MQEITAIVQKMELRSSAFEYSAVIPSLYTCEGRHYNPPLAWSRVPAAAKSLVLICSDPDAPTGEWIHWIAFNIPITVTSIPEHAVMSKLSKEIVEGTTSFGKTGYDGPCPQTGAHRYIFTLYAVDVPTLHDKEGNALTARAGVEDVRAAIQGHVVQETKLIGRYKRTKS